MDAVLIQRTLAELCAYDNHQPSDRVGNDGLLKCGKCGAAKERQWMLGKIAVMCDCEREAEERRENERRQQELCVRIEKMRRDGMADRAYCKWTFALDDGQAPDVSCTCKKFAENWEQMQDNNVGLLLYGGIGTGKTFFAACIANCLLDKGIPVLMTNFPRILNRIQSTGLGQGQNETIDALARYALVVLDDLGVERGTDYAAEQIFAVVDARYRSGKPLIVTTNLAPSDFKNPDNVRLERVYDRILENCIPVKVAGSSRRSAIAQDKRAKYAGLLGLTNHSRK